MSELIDRQAALKALRKCQTYLYGARDPKLKIELSSAKAAINNLPTIQPIATDTNVGDTISRQAAIDAAKDWYEGLICGSINGLIKRLNALPTAQPEPQKGHWIQYDKRFPWRHHYKCSVCGNYLDFTGVNGGRGEVNFCPNCGARMTTSTK